MDKIDAPILIIAIAATAGIIAAIRNLACWYWKVNERLEEQKKTNELLEKLLGKLGEK